MGVHPNQLRDGAKKFAAHSEQSFHERGQLKLEVTWDRTQGRLTKI
jgi:hypothetical protein